MSAALAAALPVLLLAILLVDVFSWLGSRPSTTPATRRSLRPLRPRFPAMYLPDDIVFIEAVPKTTVGNFDKKVLRVQYKEYQLPEK